MTTRFDTTDDTDREDGLAAAALAIRRGELVVLPTDTVYGVACDAFDPDAVTRLLDAKGRGRDMPIPVLISAVTTLDALTNAVPEWARVLVDKFWPGPLTLVCTQQASLQWDLGDARGTVAVRMPENDVTLELIQRTGPLAVSSANTSGSPPATDADLATEMLGDFVEVVLDAGATSGDQASTIVDCTGDRPHVLREGVLSARDVYGALADTGHGFDEETDDEADNETDDEADDETDVGPDDETAETADAAETAGETEAEPADESDSKDDRPLA